MQRSQESKHLGTPTSQITLCEVLGLCMLCDGHSCIRTWRKLSCPPFLLPTVRPLPPKGLTPQDLPALWSLRKASGLSLAQGPGAPENSGTGPGDKSSAPSSRSAFPKGHTPSRAPGPRERAAGKQCVLMVELLGRERRNMGNHCVLRGLKTTACLTWSAAAQVLNT